MNSRLEKVGKLRLDASEKAPLPARRWVRWLLLAIFVGSIAFLVFKNVRLPNSISRTVEVSTASASAAPVTSTSMAPTETPRLNRFTAAGYIEPIPPFPIHISPLVLGRIDEFTITEGQPVKAGQIIAKLNSQEFEKRLAELQAALGVNAERAWRWPRASLSVQKNLPLRGRQPGRNWSRPVRMPPSCVRRPSDSMPRFKPSSGRFSKRRSALRSMEYCLSVWPMQAIIIYSDSNREIASIYDPAKLQIWVDVNQRDVARLRLGQPVEVTLDAESGKVFTGEVSRILPRASLSKNTVQAKIILNEATPNFRPDMSVKVTFLEKEGATSMADKTVTPP